MPRLKLTAIDEGFTVVVSSRLLGADDPQLVQDAILKLFPDFTCGLPENPKFPSEQDDILASDNVSMQTFLEVIHNQFILDTALDYMSANLDDNGTVFNISRKLQWQEVTCTRRRSTRQPVCNQVKVIILVTGWRLPVAFADVKIFKNRRWFSMLSDGDAQPAGCFSDVPIRTNKPRIWSITPFGFIVHM